MPFLRNTLSTAPCLLSGITAKANSVDAVHRYKLSFISSDVVPFKRTLSVGFSSLLIPTRHFSCGTIWRKSSKDKSSCPTASQGSSQSNEFNRKAREESYATASNAFEDTAGNNLQPPRGRNQEEANATAKGSPAMIRPQEVEKKHALPVENLASVASVSTPARSPRRRQSRKAASDALNKESGPSPSPMTISSREGSKVQPVKSVAPNDKTALSTDEASPPMKKQRRGRKPTASTPGQDASSSSEGKTRVRKKRKDGAVAEIIDFRLQKPSSSPTPADWWKSHFISPTIYFTENCIKEQAPPTEEELVAERASVTKLFMVSDSVASFFSSLPQDRGLIDGYLNTVDKAVVASAPLGVLRRGGPAPGALPASEAYQDLRSRVLAEEDADHALSIHVRDMEQLVPPPHLLPQAPASTTAKPKRRGGRRRRQGAEEAAPPTPIERVEALKAWQREALERAQLSQQRWVVPESYHAITRVRFHKPHCEDLTVVQGCGGPKTVQDVLTAMHRKVSSMRDGTIADDEDDLAPAASVPDSVLNAISDAVSASRTVLEASDEPRVEDAILSTPYLLKPLLTVYASCIPRREAQFGCRLDEQLFFSASSTTSVAADAVKTAPAPPGPPPAHAQRGRGEEGGRSGGTHRPSPHNPQPNPLSDEDVYAALQRRGVPTIPRYSTRVTVLIEHNEMEPVDLLLLAEINTARKGGETGQNNKAYDGVHGSAAGRKLPRIYCLVVDGGEC